MNILAQGLAQQFLGPQLTAFATRFGISEATAKKVIAVAAPLLVAAIGKFMSKPGGAASLTDALARDNHSSLLDDVIGAVTGATTSKANNGTGILGHLLGDSQSGVASQLASALGIDSDNAGGMLASLAPLVMGMVGKHQTEQELDADGLAAMVNGSVDDSHQAAPDMMSSVIGMLSGSGGGSGSGGFDLGGLANIASQLFGER